ncbi:MAG: hypothetical protein P8M65_01105 [Roseibacillus sp.]|jgi:glycosyl-4,4'-diaponeurosporenoate acyltransferase|nr:hypothetical protein [Roseibacillus sp.]
MFIEVPNAVIVVLNLTVIPICHLVPSWLITRKGGDNFRPESCFFRERRWEMGGRLYERFLAVRLWKDLLPDGAPWLGGFAKKSLVGRDLDYISRFRIETCRGELAHHIQIPCVLVALLWNPWPLAAIIITGYALISNIPCIVVQRHTRHRLSRLMSHLQHEIHQKES